MGIKKKDTNQKQQDIENNLRPLWRNQDYMLLWSGQIISSLGTQVSQYAFPLLLLAISGSPLSAGLAFMLHSLPYLFLSLPAGVLIDRWNRKYIMILCDTGRTLCLVSIPIAAFFGLLAPWLLYTASFIEGILFVFFDIAEVSCLPRIVPKRQLAEANTQNMATETVSMIVGPTLCGALYSLSKSVPFLADALSYIISVISLCFIKTPLQEKRFDPPRDLWQELKEGIIWIWYHPLIRFLAFISAGKNFVGAGFVLIVIVLAETHHFSVFFTTTIFSIGGVGSILGTVLAPIIQKKLTFGNALGLISWLIAFLMPLYLLASIPLFLGIITACVFICTMNQSVLLTSYRQSLVPDKLQGRVSSVYRLVVFGGQPLDALCIGWLLQTIGVMGTIWVSTAIFGMIALAVTLNPHVRHAHLLSRKEEEPTRDESGRQGEESIDVR